MTDQTATTARTVQRGTGFPSLPLDEAVEVVTTAGRYGSAHPDAAFAGYLGHKTPNSGPFRSKMAALRDFGLIERPKKGQVPLTELGQKIAHPSGDEQTLLQQAFFSAKPFGTMYEESAKGTDLSLELIANRAVTALGVSARNKGRFAESFRRSVVAAGLGREGADRTIRLIPPAGEAAGMDAGVADATHPTPTAEPDMQPTPARAAPEGMHHVPRTDHPPIIHQEWPVKGGRVVFEVDLDAPLSGSAFGEVARIMTAVERFVASLQAVEQSGGEPPAPAEQDRDDGATE
jgi:hypothetical protein